MSDLIRRSHHDIPGNSSGRGDDPVKRANDLYEELRQFTHDFTNINADNSEDVINFATDAKLLFGTTNQRKKTQLDRVIKRARRELAPTGFKELVDRAVEILFERLYPRHPRWRNLLLGYVAVAAVIAAVLQFIPLESLGIKIGLQGLMILLVGGASIGCLHVALARMRQKDGAAPSSNRQGMEFTLTERRWGWAGAIILPVLAVIFLWLLNSNKQEPIVDAKSIIVLATFAMPDSSDRITPARLKSIQTQIQNTITSSLENIAIDSIRVDSLAAPSITLSQKDRPKHVADTSGASLVVWGWVEDISAAPELCVHARCYINQKKPEVLHKPDGSVYPFKLTSPTPPEFITLMMPLDRSQSVIDSMSNEYKMLAHAIIAAERSNTSDFKGALSHLEPASMLNRDIPERPANCNTVEANAKAFASMKGRAKIESATAYPAASSEIRSRTLVEGRAILAAVARDSYYGAEASNLIGLAYAVQSLEDTTENAKYLFDSAIAYITLSDSLGNPDALGNRDAIIAESVSKGRFYSTQSPQYPGGGIDYPVPGNGSSPAPDILAPKAEKPDITSRPVINPQDSTNNVEKDTMGSTFRSSLMAAEVEYNNGRYQQAIDSLNWLLSTFPKEPEGYKLIGKVLTRQAFPRSFDVVEDSSKVLAAITKYDTALELWHNQGDTTSENVLKTLLLRANNREKLGYFTLARNELNSIVNRWSLTHGGKIPAPDSAEYSHLKELFKDPTEDSEPGKMAYAKVH